MSEIPPRPPASRTPAGSPLLEVRALRKRFHGAAGRLRIGGGSAIDALAGVGFDLVRGGALALVGESGCGKSTLAKLLVGLDEPDGGSIRFDGQLRSALSGSERKRYRRRVQLLFQDSGAALNPRRTIEASVLEPLLVHEGRQSRPAHLKRAHELLGLVGLTAEHAGRYPHELSGGQRQRAALARALVLEPELLIADEPLTALDRSLQAQVLELLVAARRRSGLTLLLIAHDLVIARHACERIAVMLDGRIVEIAGSGELLDAPGHPYTAALIAAANLPRSWEPAAEASAMRPVGSATPSAAAVAAPWRRPRAGRSPVPPAPSSCPYLARCERASALCAESDPRLQRFEPSRLLACHHPLPQRPPAGGVGSAT